MKEKLKLVPVPVEWQAGRFGIKVESIEEDEVDLSIITTFLGGEDKLIRIKFKLFAEFKCINLNFAEHNYNEYLIKTPSGEFVNDTYDWHNIKQSDYWIKNRLCYDPFFYTVENTQWFQEKEPYLNLQERGFEHFILVGYDSYIELLAQKDFEWMVVN